MLQVKNFTLKVLGEVFFINCGVFLLIFVACYRTQISRYRLSIAISFLDSYTVRRHSEKNVIVTGQSVTIT